MPEANVTVTAKFEVKYHQYLDEKGELTKELPSSEIDPDKLIEMYKLMSKVRAFDHKAVTLQRTGKMGTYAGILGQEAIYVAIGDIMRTDDVFAPSYRDYGAFLQRGRKMSHILAYWGGDERGNDFDNVDDLPICVPIATQSLHATGIATAFKLRKEDRVVVTTIGEGGTSQGDFYEALNVAGAWNLPVVFVVNNNQWAISISRETQTAAETIAQKAIAAGFNGIQVDGNDIVVLRESLDKAIERARSGGGPTLIEAITYRLCDHTTADDAKRYRPDEEVEEAWKKEPLIRLRTYLTHLGVWDEEKETLLQEEAAKEVEENVQTYLNTTPQPPEAIFDYLYEKLPEPLRWQRNQLLEGK